MISKLITTALSAALVLGTASATFAAPKDKKQPAPERQRLRPLRHLIARTTAPHFTKHLRHSPCALQFLSLSISRLPPAVIRTDGQPFWATTFGLSLGHGGGNLRAPLYDLMFQRRGVVARASFRS